MILQLISVLFSSGNRRGQTTTVSKKRENGLYDVSVFKTLSEEDLRPETVFGCVLTIPGTEYSIKEETMYFPGKGKIYNIDSYQF